MKLIESFHLKVKQRVADNFDQSCRIYQDFEEKHHFFYDLTVPAGDDLFAVAFQRLGEPLPRFRVITDYRKASSALVPYS